MSKTIPWFGLPFNMGELSESLRIISSNQNISNFETAFAQKWEQNMHIQHFLPEQLYISF